MITIQSGKLMIPENERFVGFAGDDRAVVRTILLPEDCSDHGCVYTLFLRFDDDRVTSAPLTVHTEGNELVAVWDVRREQILKPGIVMAQLRMNREDGTVVHTGCDYFVVAVSAELADDGGEIDILNRTEFEERMAQAVREAKAIAPYIGGDGYWYVYSTQDEEYVRSFYALGPVVDSALSGVSANPVENRVVKTALDAKVDTTRRIASLPLSGDISKDDLVENIIGKINPPLITPGVTAGYPAQYGKTSDGRPVFCSGMNTWVALAEAGDIPTAVSELTNDSGYLTAHQDISGKMALMPTNNSIIEALGTLPNGQLFKCQGEVAITDQGATEGYILLARDSDLSVKENTSNKVTSLSAQSTDTQYPSAKCVYDMIGDIESLLSGV